MALKPKHIIDITSGLVTTARQVPSEHCDEREDCSQPDLLVVHNISLPPNTFGGPYIDQLFTGQLDPNEHDYFKAIAALRVSSHLLIRRDGEVVQYVPLHKRAWHAGVSVFEGREKCNDYSIGIELEGADDIEYEEIQYEILSELTHAIQQAYPQISQNRITGHCDIAPGRKTDPGEAFDWSHYFTLLQQYET